MSALQDLPELVVDVVTFGGPGRLAASMLLDSTFGARVEEIGRVTDDGVTLTVTVPEPADGLLSSGEVALLGLLRGLSDRRDHVSLHALGRVDDGYRALVLSSLRLFLQLKAAS